MVEAHGIGRAAEIYVNFNTFELFIPLANARRFGLFHGPRDVGNPSENPMSMSQRKLQMKARTSRIFTSANIITSVGCFSVSFFCFCLSVQGALFARKTPQQTESKVKRFNNIVTLGLNITTAVCQTGSHNEVYSFLVESKKWHSHGGKAARRAIRHPNYKLPSG